MKNAAEKKKLYKEKQYVMGVSAQEVYPDYNGKEMVLIQGIIDAYFEEENQIIIVDYKTDRVKEEEELKKRYKIQLDFYGKH
jgi:ATP-dependent helicase/nuclease subunit A